MTARRGLSTLVFTAGIGMAALVLMGATSPSTGAPVTYSDALTARFAKEYRDPGLAATIVAGLNADLLAKLEARVPLAQVATSPFLAYLPPRVAAKNVDSVVAFAFGNRRAVDGSLQPGPVNEALAKVTQSFVADHRVPVYAQTEIAQLLQARGVKRVTSIDPVVGDDGKVVYLSTAGVAEQVLSKAQAAGEPLGTVGVIGFSDHVVRCVLTARAAGMTGAVPKGIRLPHVYDPQSAQSWTTNRASYLTTDLIGRLTTL